MFDSSFHSRDPRTMEDFYRPSLIGRGGSIAPTTVPGTDYVSNNHMGITMIDRDKIMVAAGENIMRKTPQEAYDLIENMTQHHYKWDSEVQYDTTTDMSAHYSKTTFASSEQVETDAFLALDSILPGIDNEIFDVEEDILLLEKLLNIDSTKDLPPLELNNDSRRNIYFS
ncbi:hypothetical protein Tco_0861891 [Tanacetum coccineum]